MADIDLNQLTNLTTQQRTGTQGLLAGQNTQSADYLKRYTDFINSQEGSQAAATRIGAELGLPSLQQNATSLRNLYTNLPQTYSKSMTGYDVNSSQLSRIIGQKASELAPALQTAETSLADVQNQVGQRLGYQQADLARTEKPYAVEQSMLADRQAREATMFSEQNSNELNALIAKIQTGAQLSIAEANRAQELAIAEKNFELEKQKISASQTTTSPYMAVGEGTAIYDPTTGKMIYRNPKTYAPSTSTGTWG